MSTRSDVSSFTDATGCLLSALNPTAEHSSQRGPCSDTSDYYRGRSEDELLTLALAQDDLAFEELVARSLPIVRRMINRLANSQQDAEDALQDALTRAYVKLHTFHRQCLFRTWLVRIALNSTHMLNRRERRHRQAVSFVGEDGANDLDFLTDAKPSPLDVALSAEKTALLAEAMKQLPPSLKRVILEQFYAHRSIREIANETGLTESAVKSRLNRARARLAKSARGLLDARTGLAAAQWGDA